MSGFRCQFCKGSLTKVHYPKLYNMAHLLSLNVFTASEGSNNYILLFNTFSYISFISVLGNRYVPEDIRLRWIDGLSEDSSGILGNVCICATS